MMPDSQLVGILIAAMVAGVLLFRLYTVLGRRRMMPVLATGRHRPCATRAP
jgi:hypothetical protein